MTWWVVDGIPVITITMFELVFYSKGSETEPKYQSTRLLFLLMMVTSVVLFENFGASYTSFLSVVTPSVPFRTVEELYTNTEYKIGDKGGTNQRINFKVCDRICIILYT